MTARSTVQLGSWLATVAGCAAVLASAPLPVPPADSSAMLDWPAEVGPIAAALGVIRVAALTAAAITLIATVVGLAARAMRWVRLAGACDRFTLPPVRRLLDVVTAGSLAAVVAVAPVAAGAVESPPPTPALRSLDTPPPTLRRVQAAPTPQPPAPERTPAPEQPPGPAPVPADTVVVQPGDSFWRIAEQIVSDRQGRPASDAEVAAYWRRLVHANVDRLAVAGEPDLIFAGQEFRLP